MINPLLNGLNNKLEKNEHDIILVDCKTETNISAKSFWKNSHQIAHCLEEHNVTRGSYVVVSMPSSALFCQTIYATFILGAIPVFMDPGMRIDHLSKCVEDINPAIWLNEFDVNNFKTTNPEILAKSISSPSQNNFKPLPDLQPDSPCLMLYTSGTTGLPKGVPWTCSQLESHIRHQENYYEKFFIESEYALFSHLAIIALSMQRQCIIPALNSNQPSLMDMEEAYRQMEIYGCDYTFASPAFWHRMVKFCQSRNLTLSRLKVATTAGAAVNKDMLIELSNVLPQGRIFVPYASTEVIMPISNIELSDLVQLTEDSASELKGTPLGTPANDTEIRIISRNNSNKSTITNSDSLPNGEIGEIIVSSPRVTLNYFKRPDLNREMKLKDSENGKIWHKMGDIGYLDDAGNLWFLSRKKYVYQTKSGAIYPDQQELFYNHHLGIYESAIVFDSSTEKITLIIPIDSSNPGQAELVHDLATQNKLQPPSLAYFPGKLPTDPRHNSKINRDALLEWLHSSEKFSIN